MDQSEFEDKSKRQIFDFDISIVIVNYNVRDFLSKCLLSIRESQTNLKIETIVVDNNSTDGSVNFLKNTFTEVKFISLNENLGFSKANNVGFKESHGKYILILNPDTILEKNTLNVMYDYMESNREVWISGCKILNPDGSFQLPCRRGFPTPWVAFSKLFGLQSLFPKSKLFAKYNQTFRSIDETYYIDAVMGAFMFARADKINLLRGFDEDYFMYGEDIDLCYRTAELGGKVAYVHSTTITHYKGESTKRSSINDIRHFYEAMQIFVKKYYSNSSFFLALLKLGIFIRTFLAYISKYKKDFPLIIIDLIIVNFVLMGATKVRFEQFLGFPAYAYPTVFIVISIIFFISLFAVGEYFEGEHSIRKLLFGVSIAFFFLIALTYFFKTFAFSRGVLLMTIGLSFLLCSLIRIIFSSFWSPPQENRKRKIALVSKESQIESILEEYKAKQLDTKFELIGLFTFEKNITSHSNIFPKNLIFGNFDFLVSNVFELNLDEVIIFKIDKNSDELKTLFSKTFDRKIGIHFLTSFDEYIVSEIISEVSSSQPVLINHKLLLPRFKFAKRLVDLISSSIMLTAGLPIIFLNNKNRQKNLKNLINVFIGNFSLVGIYPTENIRNYNSKPGIYNLVLFSNEINLKNENIQKLNDYYESNYSISLDFDIFIKSVFK